MGSFGRVLREPGALRGGSHAGLRARGERHGDHAHERNTDVARPGAGTYRGVAHGRLGGTVMRRTQVVSVKRSGGGGIWGPRTWYEDVSKQGVGPENGGVVL